MTTDLPTWDAESIRAVTGPNGRWAVDCGAKVKARREALNFTRAQVARSTGSTEMTVFRVEAGSLIPRDYLRAAFALALFCEVEDLWPPLTRAQLVAELEAAS